MSYFNPKIYNIQNLTEEDRDEVLTWRDAARYVAEDLMDYTSEGKDTLEKIRAEIRNEVLDEYLEHFDAQIVDLIIGLIDGYTDDVPITEKQEIESPGGLVEWDRGDEKK